MAKIEDLSNGADIDGFLSGASESGPFTKGSILTKIEVGSKPNFELGEIQGSEATGIDALFQREPHIVSAHKTGRKKVASLGDLSNFVRVSNETLIHKSQRDLWTLKREGGDFFIERLFDDNGEPLKG
jgi:hypothetical protein